MFNKIVGILLAVLFVAVGVLAFAITRTSTIAGAESNSGSLYITPQSSWGDTYTMAFGTSPYSSPTKTLIDINGNYVGTVNGSFIGSTPVNGTTSLATTTLGTITQTTSTAFGSLVINLGTTTYPNLKVGNACSIDVGGLPTSSAFGADGFVSVIGGVTSTAVYTLWNGTTTVETIASTSILSATCLH